MPGRHLPPDHSRGDESTLGGYMAVHARPAAFEGLDGAAYSVDIAIDERDAAGASAEPDDTVGEGRFEAYLLFVKWSTGEPRVVGHLESGVLARGATEAEARSRIGALPLVRVKETLDTLIRARWPAPDRPWWEAMRDEGRDDEGGAEGRGA